MTVQRLELHSGHEMAYTDDGDGHPVVFVHGGFMSHRVWDAQRFAFEDDYRVVCVDLLGHGASDKPDLDYTPALYADHLQELLESLDLAAATVVGWSLGATTAVTHMRRHGDRVRDLVLVCSGIFRWMLADPDGEEGIDLDGLLAAMVDDHPATMREFVDGLFAVDVSDETVEWFWQIAMQQPLHVAHDVLNIYVDVDYDRLRATVEEIEVPTAVFQGGEDTAATLDQAARVADDLLPDGSFEPFEASGHVPFVEERDRFDRTLRSFVEE